MGGWGEGVEVRGEGEGGTYAIEWKVEIRKSEVSTAGEACRAIL